MKGASGICIGMAYMFTSYSFYYYNYGASNGIETFGGLLINRYYESILVLLIGNVIGIIIAFMVLSPSATLIGWKEPTSLIPISIMTTILGSISGLVIHKLTNKIHK